MSKIEQLQSELNKKVNELNESLNTQYLLHETLRKNIKTLGEIESLLKTVTANLKYSNECVGVLRKENQILKATCDVWMQRAIKLEFEVLSVRDAAKK